MRERLNRIRLRKAKEMGINLAENNCNDNESIVKCQNEPQI